MTDAPHVAVDPAAARPDGAERAERLVAEAVDAVARAWPLDSFVAVNPLAGWEGDRFDEAVVDAAATFGARTLPSEEEQRRDLAAGRLGEVDLAQVLRDRGLVGGALEADASHLETALGCSATELLVADLLVGSPAAPTERTVMTPAELLDSRDGGRRAESVDEQVAAWCAVVLDDHATWRPPRVERGLWGAWRFTNERDRRLPVEARSLVATLPEDPAEAVDVLLAELGVGAAAAGQVVLAELTALPGWVTHLRSRAAGDPSAAPDELVAYLAVRLGVEALVVGREVGLDGGGAPVPDPGGEQGSPGDESSRVRALAALTHVGGRRDAEAVAAAATVLETLPPDARQLVWLEAAEVAYRRQLLTSLPPAVDRADDRADGALGRPRGLAERPAAQILCCIDVRSEGLRRHLERLAGWETFGIAGFFALAIRFHRDGEALETARCPVILSPDLEAVECLDATPHGWRSDATYATGEDAFHSAKEGITAPLALAEMAGWLAGPEAALRTFLPGRLRRRPAGVPSHVELPGVAGARRVDLAAGLLAAIGLTSEFARLVVLCGHGSTTVNNPYAAGLACGACGGQPGAQNARVGVGLLNDPAVRVGLADRGIAVPDDTWFLAAEHDTASDDVTLFDLDAVPASHAEDVVAARAQLLAAGQELRSERAEQLPGTARRLRRRGSAGGGRSLGARDDGRLRRRGQDWAEVVPEWGLAGTAAMVIAPRAVTAPADLARRVFLHSYEPEQDPDGSVLAAILGGPLVVGHWISSQYFFSSVDPEAFGAGTKATHNILGGAATLSGPGGDLRRGLPLQSFRVGDVRIHQPLRLLAVIQAPLERIDAALAAAPDAERLVDGGWLALAARADVGSPWSRRREGSWAPWAGLGPDTADRPVRPAPPAPSAPPGAPT